MNLTIFPRRDLEENWVLENPVLREKEFIVSVDKGIIKYKLGNGESNYIDLPFTNLFEAIMFGIIYAHPNIPAPYQSVKLRLLDEELIKYINENYNIR